MARCPPNTTYGAVLSSYDGCDGSADNEAQCWRDRDREVLGSQCSSFGRAVAVSLGYGLTPDPAVEQAELSGSGEILTTVVTGRRCGIITLASRIGATESCETARLRRGITPREQSPWRAMPRRGQGWWIGCGGHVMAALQDQLSSLNQ